MIKYLIETNIPIPGRVSHHSTCPFPFDEMDVGDSFICHDNKVFAWRTKYQNMTNKKFATRTIKCGEWRIWRIE